MASLVYFVVVYIRHMASMAPGVLAAACGLAEPGVPTGSSQPSGSTHSNVKTALQYEPHWVSQATVFIPNGW
jgi:hypothetical protein